MLRSPYPAALIIAFVVACSLAPHAVAQDDAPPVRPYLSLESARAGAEACLNYAKDNDLRIAIAILDRGGRDVLSLRMDDVFQKQIEFASIKAETASTTPLSTKRLGEVSGVGTPLEGLVQVPGLNRVEGGEPIKLPNGYAIGGVGVSGASPAQDGECARAAVATIAAFFEE